jgi:catechol 2,3-dioxygenase-like lactoylglutathione lyase family enzyme
VHQRVDAITLGVTELRQAQDFYEALGWRPAASTNGTVSFEAGGLTVVFRDRGQLATDCGAFDPASWDGGVMLHHLVESLIDVEMVLAEARGAGATITHPASSNLQGGYSGIFLDLDRHAWKVTTDLDPER